MRGTVEKKKRIVAIFKEQLAMHNLIAKHLHKDGDFWAYDEGWSDEAIAKAVNPDFNYQHAQGIRTASFGKLRPRSGGLSPLALEKRVDELEAIVRKLADALL